MEELHLELFLLVILLTTARILYVVHKITTGFSKNSPHRTKPCSTLVCIGSGGHTTEMIKLLGSLDFNRYLPRHYIIAKSDKTSIGKVMQLERTKEAARDDEIRIYKIPRSRSVHQSYLSTIFTTFYSILYSVPIVCKLRPDLILCNGPGTCIPVCVVAFLLKVVFVCDTKIIFVESFCRTQTFSLTGKILVYFADNILVQWPNLKKKLKRADYIGQLM